VDLSVVSYLVYLGVTVPLTVWVGRALRRHGEVFLVDVFLGDVRLADAVNQLLVIGFYLLNFGYLMFFMATTKQIDTGRALMEAVSTKIGGVALVVGLVHFGNVWCLNLFRRRAVLRAQAQPPMPPNGYTPVAYAPAAYPPPV
jgi:hypothetical protein